MGKRKTNKQNQCKQTEGGASELANRSRTRHKREIRVDEDESDTSGEISFDEELADTKAAAISRRKTKDRDRDRDSATSSEEERWLDAIESGKLEEVDDELKKMKLKDPKMMTARQRAMYEKGTDKESTSGEALLSLPSGYKTKVMTAEDIEKAAIKAQKRKQLADEKREKDKKTTMERLLKKQESKSRTPTAKSKSAKTNEPVIVYKSTVDGITLTFPPEIPFPIEAKADLEAPKPVLCGIEGCNNVKRYSCSQTNIPLCSLECYKKNLHNAVVS